MQVVQQKVRALKKCSSLFCAVALEAPTKRPLWSGIMLTSCDAQLIEYDKESGNLRRGSHCVDL